MHTLLSKSLHWRQERWLHVITHHFEAPDDIVAAHASICLLLMALHACLWPLPRPFFFFFFFLFLSLLFAPVLSDLLTTTTPSHSHSHTRKLRQGNQTNNGRTKTQTKQASNERNFALLVWLLCFASKKRKRAFTLLFSCLPCLLALLDWLDCLGGRLMMGRAKQQKRRAHERGNAGENTSSAREGGGEEGAVCPLKSQAVKTCHQHRTWP